MNKISLSAVLCAALALSACGDDTEPAEGAVTTPAGVVTEDQADVLEDRADAFEETLPEDAQDTVAIEERADVL